MKPIKLVATIILVVAFSLSCGVPWLGFLGDAQARIRLSPIRGGIVYSLGRTAIRKQIVGGTTRQTERIIAKRLQRKLAAKALDKSRREAIAKVVPFSRQRYGSGAKHAADAQAKGHPSVLTIDRTMAKARRRQAVKNTPTRPGHDRDEYPPAMFKEGGLGASIRHLPSSINRACGAYLGHQCSKLANGAKILLKLVD